MAKETYIRLRCTEEFKQLVDQAAKMETRTISNYMENLLLTDIKEKGLDLEVLKIGGKNIALPKDTKEIVYIDIPKGK